MAFLIICTLLIPAVQLLAGWAMRFHAPKKINAWVGYRTTRSMQSKAAWEFANWYCGKLWMLVGSVMLAVSGLAYLGFLFLPEQAEILLLAVMIGVQILVLLLTIPPVERALKKNFGKQGEQHD